MSVDVVYDAILGTGVNLRQVTQSSFSENIDVLEGRQSGSPTISDQFVDQVAAEAQLTTVDIGGFLTAFGANGSQVASGDTVVIPYHKRISGGSFAGGSSNLKITGVTGCPVQLVPMTVTAPTKGAPTAQGQAHFLSSDGKTAPYAVAANQALASQAFAAMYGLGPIYVNGVLVPRNLQYSVHFGVGFSEKKYYDGAPYPSDIFIETLNPVIEFSQEDFDYLATLAGGIGLGTGLTAWLRKRASGSTYVADATAAHISFSFAAGFLRSTGVSASETKNGQNAVRCEGRTLVIGNGVALS